MAVKKVAKKVAKKTAKKAAKAKPVKMGHTCHTVQIGKKGRHDEEVSIRVSSSTADLLYRLSDRNGVVHISEDDFQKALHGLTDSRIAISMKDSNEAFSVLPFIEKDPKDQKNEEEINILLKANEIIYGDREKAYGSPRFNLDTIAKFWTLYLHRLFHSWGIEGATLQAEDVAQMMILLKTARLIHNPTHVDSLTDQAGYAALQHRIQGL